jgi:hypothetical protein
MLGTVEPLFLDRRDDFAVVNDCRLTIFHGVPISRAFPLRFQAAMPTKTNHR